jgi:hypothetical protein
MKINILAISLAVLLLFPTSGLSCSSGIDQNQYDRALQELNVLREKKAKAELYTLFLDLLMSQFFQQANVASRYQFNSIEEWSRALDTMATTINDNQLNTLMTKMKKDVSAIFEVQSYVISQITMTLK